MAHHYDPPNTSYDPAVHMTGIPKVIWTLIRDHDSSLREIPNCDVKILILQLVQLMAKNAELESRLNSAIACLVKP